MFTVILYHIYSLPSVSVLNDFNWTLLHFNNYNSLSMSVVFVTLFYRWLRMVLTCCVYVCLSSTCRTLKAATGRSSTARG